VIHPKPKRRKRPVRAATRHRRAKLAGITAMGGYDYQCMAQGLGCAICGYAPKPGQRRLNIDHDHTSGTVRGLLCGRCNRGLAFYRDDHHKLMAAAVYLRHGWRAACAYRDAVPVAVQPAA